MEESTHGPSSDMCLCFILSCEYAEETRVWLSCDSNSKALNLTSWLLSLRLIIGAWIGIFPSSMLTTDDMVGLRVGDGLVHKSAKLSILMASSGEYFEPRFGSTNSRRFPCSWRTYAYVENRNLTKP